MAFPSVQQRTCVIPSLPFLASRSLSDFLYPRMDRGMVGSCSTWCASVTFDVNELKKYTLNTYRATMENVLQWEQYMWTYLEVKVQLFDWIFILIFRPIRAFLFFLDFFFCFSFNFLLCKLRKTRLRIKVTNTFSCEAKVTKVSLPMF